MQVMAYLSLWRLSPPKLSNSQWSHTIKKGILQQFGGTTLPCPGRRELDRSIAEDIEKITTLSIGIKHYEMREQPLLESLRA